MRSKTVHGQSANNIDTRLPGNETATLPIFTDVIEEIVRIGITKALSMRADGAKLRNFQYWDDIIFPSPCEPQKIDGAGDAPLLESAR